MRKVICSALVWLCVLCIACAGLAEEIQTINEVSAQQDGASDGVQANTVLNVGTDNPISGYFSTDMWGNNASDMDVRTLLHGYETVVWTDDMGMLANPTVIKSLQRENVSDGQRFVIELTPGLTYNDGTPITAKDYVFSLLMMGAPAMEEIGATLQGYGHIRGYDEYQSGASKTLAGVRLLSDLRFSVEVRGDHMPYYYDLAAISVRPYPPGVIAPDCEIRDEGHGVYIDGDFNANMLRKTMLDPDTGYLFNPKVTSGAYSLDGYDKQTGVVSFTVNPRFVGNHSGETPRIEKVTFRHVPLDKVEAALASGEINLQARVTDVELMRRVQQEIASGAAFEMVAYPRTGFAFLSFACELGPTSSTAVRRAIAMSLDKDALIANTLAESALRSYGYYGLGQWMVAYADEGVDGGAPLRILDELSGLDIPLDLDGARALLEQDGWVLDSNAQTYKQGGGMRHKNDNGNLTPLIIRWAVTKDEAVAAETRALLEKTFAELGIGLEVTELDFQTLLKHYYRQEARTYNMFSLASNFTYIFDPYYDFNTGDVYQGQVNTTGLKDAALMSAAETLKRTEPGAQRLYVERWLAFQRQFVQALPMVPLYSNVYFDIVTSSLEGYDATGNIGWASGILGAHMIQPTAIAE